MDERQLRDALRGRARELKRREAKMPALVELQERMAAGGDFLDDVRAEKQRQRERTDER